jgi:DNA-binding IclR family transcriptional regulator
MAQAIPDDLRRFILTSIPSVPYLEAILVLRSDTATAWDAPTLARRLYLPEPAAAGLLQAMKAAGIVEQEAGATAYAYRPGPELGALLTRLAALYAAELFGVTELIHSKVDRRAQQFADAFRLRKDS